MFKYFGSKYKIGHEYPAPRHDTIIEPFAGSAAYAVRHRRRASRVILIEKDLRVVKLWHRLLSTSRDDLLDLPDPVVGERRAEPAHRFRGGTHRPRHAPRRLHRQPPYGATLPPNDSAHGRRH